MTSTLGDRTRTQHSDTPVLPQHPRPSPSTPRPYAFPRFERRTLANGVGLVVAPVPTFPLVSVLAVVDAGAMADPPGMDGLALLTARSLAEGAGARDGAALTDAAERLGAAIDTRADWDAALVRLTVLSTRLDEALTLVGDILMAPTFPEREVERLKAERLADLLQLRAEPRGLADEMMERFVYAPESRYAAPEGGSEASVRALTRAHVVEFYGTRYQPGRLTIVVAGDVTVDAAAALVETVFGRWAPRDGIVPAAGVADRAASGAPAVHIVARPDAPQSELRVAHVGVPRSSADYFPITIMNAILGGLFSSRINLNLREAHGYTYSAHSSYDWRRAAGPFSVSTAVQSTVTDAAAREVMTEITRLRESEVTESELSLATNYLDGVFPIRYETTSAIATALANLVIYGLRDDYYDRYRANIRAQTASDILRAARAHLHPDRLQLVVVGDPERVRIPLEQLGVGPVTTYDDRGERIA